MTEKQDCQEDGSVAGPGEELVKIDWQRYERPAQGIIEAIAGVTDERPTELPPLGSELDVDALNDLLVTSTEASTVTISFEYQGFAVTVEQSGTLVVETVTEES